MYVPITETRHYDKIYMLGIFTTLTFDLWYTVYKLLITNLTGYAYIQWLLQQMTCKTIVLWSKMTRINLWLRQVALRIRGCRDWYEDYTRLPTKRNIKKMYKRHGVTRWERQYEYHVTDTSRKCLTARAALVWVTTRSAQKPIMSFTNLWIYSVRQFTWGYVINRSQAQKIPLVLFLSFLKFIMKKFWAFVHAADPIQIGSSYVFYELCKASSSYGFLTRFYFIVKAQLK